MRSEIEAVNPPEDIARANWKETKLLLIGPTETSLSRIDFNLKINFPAYPVNHQIMR